MLAKTYNFVDRNAAKIMDGIASILLIIATLVFADNIAVLFLLTMSLLPLQEIVRKDNISWQRFACMTIFGLVTSFLALMSGPAVASLGVILRTIYWAN